MKTRGIELRELLITKASRSSEAGSLQAVILCLPTLSSQPGYLLKAYPLLPPGWEECSVISLVLIPRHEAVLKVCPSLLPLVWRSRHR